MPDIDPERRKKQDEYLAKYHPELLRAARQSEARSVLAGLQQLAVNPKSEDE